MGYYYNNLQFFDQTAIYLSDYVHLILAAGFGLIICATILSILFAMTNQRVVPSCSVFLIIVSILLLWVFVAISGSVSLILAKECNNGIDNLTYKYILNGSYSDCVTTSLKHYLFCNPWNTTANSCTNPISPLENRLLFIINFIINTKNPALDYFLETMQGGLNTLKAIDSCNNTITVYSDSKQNICFQVNNATIQITLLYIIQAPILIVLLIYILFGWYRFHFQRLPYVIHHPKTTDPNSILSNEELETLITSDAEIEKLQDPQEDNSLLPVADEPLPSAPNEEMEELKSTLKENIRTLVFTGFLLLVVFLMIFVWFGFLGNVFSF